MIPFVSPRVPRTGPARLLQLSGKVRTPWLSLTLSSRKDTRAQIEARVQMNEHEMTPAVPVPPASPPAAGVPVRGAQMSSGPAASPRPRAKLVKTVLVVFFVAVVLGRRIAFSRNLFAQQMGG